MGKTVAYIRVSTKDQNLDRQKEEMLRLGIEEKHIYEDKASGKDFDRIGYQYMKRALDKGDTLVIRSLDRLGRNQDQIKDEWEWFNENEVNVRVLDMPALNIDYSSPEMQSMYKMIRNIVFEVMSWQAEEERSKIKQRQAEGIAVAKAKGKHLGRPRFDLESLSSEQRNLLEGLYTKWQHDQITAVEFMGRLGLKRNTFYRIIKQYGQKLS